MRLFLLSLLALAACDSNKDVKKDDLDSGTPMMDRDGDGSPDEEDCAPDDASSYPGAPELCDDVDNNCDGTVDEGVGSTWYTDADGDGYGDSNSAVVACEQPEGTSATDGDCDDALDDVNPGAPERCDGLDNDCNGQIDDDVLSEWYADTDGDGHGDPAAPIDSCDPPEGYVPSSDDCDDDNASVSPSATELCNGLDDDCDGTTDEPDAADAATWYQDMDSDGYGDPDFAQSSCSQPTGYAAEGGDCDDAEAAVHPNATELCNGYDDDCDGIEDEADAADAPTWYHDLDGDGYGDPDSTLVQCDQPSGYVSDSRDCDDGAVAVNPAATERCNGYDDDCDGTIDEDDAADAATWYADTDSDSYGDANATTLSCDQPQGYVSDSTDCDDSLGAVHPTATEYCNGYDDDCDGTIDEDDAADAASWYADTDSDGFGDAAASTLACDQPSGYEADDTDCDDTDASIYPGAPDPWYDNIDQDCDGDTNPSVCDEVPGGTTVAFDSTCVFTPPGASSWNVQVEWSTDSADGYVYSTAPTYTRIMMSPVVGQLSDDNGDGLINELDTPDIAYTTFAGNAYTSAGYLRVVSGDTGVAWLSVGSVSTGSGTANISGIGGIALGDLEGDGLPEIVVMAIDGKVIALSNTGTFKWISSVTASYSGYPAIADLDGDGDAEVISGAQILNYAGATIATMSYSGGNISYPADIDDDGVLEVVTGNAVYEPDGTRDWATGSTSTYSAVGNFDSDSYGEIVMHTGGNLVLYDHNGTAIRTISAGTSAGGPPCIGDVDGDGDQDIVAAGSSYLVAYTVTGTRLWRLAVRDSSSQSASCTLFDFDGDGAQEILYADEYDFFVVDGTTGAILYTAADHASGTVREHPLVADVDGDGKAEIVVPNNDYARTGWDGLYVLGEANDMWPSARMIFNQHAYWVNHINDDMTMATNPELPWVDPFTFRGQVSGSDDPLAAPNLAPALLGVCEDCGGGTAEVYVSLENTGALFVPAGVMVSLYADNGSSRTLLDILETPERADPGERLAPLVFTVDIADYGSAGLVVVVDDDGSGGGEHTECDESDNEVSWNSPSCTN